MKSKHFSISLAELEKIPQLFGWKVEYYDDQAHITPRDMAIRTKLDIHPIVKTSTYNLQPIDAGYKQQMIEVFYQSFLDSAEFCDWTKKDLRKHADRNINNYFIGFRGQPLTQSVMAIEPKTKQVIGGFVFDSQKTALRIRFIVSQSQIPAARFGNSDGVACNTAIA